MEMHQIKYFLAVSRTLNFTRAADQCNVTQPSLTRAIQKLEEEFGGPLFNRERSLTHLTELGRMVLPHLEQTYEAAEAASQLASSIGRAEVAPLVIGVASGVTSAVLDDILAALAASLPGLTLDLRSGTSDHLIEQALKGGMDLLIVALPDQAPDRLDTWPLYRQAYGIVTWAGHPLSGGGAGSLADQAGAVTIDCGDDGAALWRATAAAAGLEPVFRHRVETVTRALRLIAARVGSAVLPVASVPPEDPPTLAVLGMAEGNLSLPIVLGAVAGRRRGRAAEAFVRAARARDWSEAAVA